jgi:hypothetical protein
MRRFLINLVLFNREFITKYKEHILKEKQMNESFISNSLNETFLNNESFSDNKLKTMRNYTKSKTIMVSPTSFTFGKMKSANIKEISNFRTSSKFMNESSSQKFEMNNLNNDNFSDLNELEEYYYNENHDIIEDNKSKNADNDNNYSQKIQFSSGINSAEISQKEIKEEKKEDIKEDKKGGINEDKDKERNNSHNSQIKSNENLNRFSSNEKKSIQKQNI